VDAAGELGQHVAPIADFIGADGAIRVLARAANQVDGRGERGGILRSLPHWPLSVNRPGCRDSPSGANQTSKQSFPPLRRFVGENHYPDSLGLCDAPRLGKSQGHLGMEIRLIVVLTESWSALSIHDNLPILRCEVLLIVEDFFGHCSPEPSIEEI
jgi:hypothetical protein